MFSERISWKVHHPSDSQMMSPDESSLQIGFLLYMRLIQSWLDNQTGGYNEAMPSGEKQHKGSDAFYVCG